jgi:DNA polymerase I-like protein with 3'-5' exonuclease and polymerase domains
MELVGMPMDLNQIEQAEASLTKTVNKYRKQLNKCPLIKDFTWKLNKQLFIETNKNYKKKFKPLEEFNTQFNPDSSVQLQKLLYSEMGFEIVDVTDKGSPATGKDTLEKMLNKLMKEYDITEEELNEQTTGNSKS